MQPLACVKNFHVKKYFASLVDMNPIAGEDHSDLCEPKKLSIAYRGAHKTQHTRIKGFEGVARAQGAFAILSSFFPGVWC